MPAGTPVMSATAGVVTVSDTGGDCGHGVIIAGDDGATYTYCHGSSDLVTAGQRVATGPAHHALGLVRAMSSRPGPAGAHLHFQINIPNVAGTVCPQSALVAWADSVHHRRPRPPLARAAPTASRPRPSYRRSSSSAIRSRSGSGPSLTADLSATGAAVTVDAVGRLRPDQQVVDYRTRIPDDVAAIHPDLVVIALGTNDSGAGSAYGADVDAVMSSLPAGQQVIWVLPRRPASLQPGIGQLAASVYAAVGRWPGLRVADTDGIMSLHPEWVAADGIHYNPPATRRSATPSSPTWRRASDFLWRPPFPAPPPPPRPRPAIWSTPRGTTASGSTCTCCGSGSRDGAPPPSTPSSGAYGIPQALPADKMASAGADWLTNPITQIRWGISYIQGRYGSPAAAWAHEESFGWY